MDKRFIIIANVSDASQHASWLMGSPLFDVFLNYVGDTEGLFKEDATFYEYTPSLTPDYCDDNGINPIKKFSSLGSLVEQYWELLATYDAFWFPDDTLISNTDDINRFFKLFDGHDLALAEPSLIDTQEASPNLEMDKSQTTPQCLMRFVNYIDTLAPLMSRDCLMALHPSFSGQSSHSIEPSVDILSKSAASPLYLEWAQQLKDNKNKLAVFDAIKMARSSTVEWRKEATTVSGGYYYVDGASPCLNIT